MCLIPRFDGTPLSQYYSNRSKVEPPEEACHGLTNGGSGLSPIVRQRLQDGDIRSQLPKLQNHRLSRSTPSTPKILTTIMPAHSSSGGGRAAMVQSWGKA